MVPDLYFLGLIDGGVRKFFDFSGGSLIELRRVTREFSGKTPIRQFRVFLLILQLLNKQINIVRKLTILLLN